MLDTRKRIVQLVLVKAVLSPRVLLQKHLTIQVFPLAKSPMVLQVQTSAFDPSEGRNLKR